MGLGSILGGILSGLVARKMKFDRAYVLLSGAAVCIFPMGLAAVTNRFPYVSYILIMLAVLFIMCFATLFSVFAQTLMQKLTPNHLLGKAAAVVTVICTCAYPAGQAMYGILFEKAGQYAFGVVLISGIVSALIAVLSRKVIGRIPM